SEYTFGASHLVLQQSGFTPWEPFTSVVAMILSPLPKGVVWGLGAAMFWVHLTIILTFLNFLPLGKHFHVITALPDVFFQSLNGSRALPTPNLEAEQFGAKTVRDLTWKNGLDLYSCTECGRCQTHCPTYVTGKPLTHKGGNQDLKHWSWAHQEEVANIHQAPGAGAELPSIIGSALKAETVWACTTCGWCERACPVFIENVPRLIDMRRYQVQVEASFPQEIQRVFEGMERQGNPWGVGQDRGTSGRRTCRFRSGTARASTSTSSSWAARAATTTGRRRSVGRWCGFSRRHASPSPPSASRRCA